MSLSTLKAKHSILQFDKESFPRFQKTQQRIECIVHSVKDSINNVAEHFKWTYKMDDPQIVLCYGNKRPSIDLDEFAVHVTNEKENWHDIDSELDDTVPFLLICEVETNGSASLTVNDKIMLNGLRELHNKYIENILFVIDQPIDSLTTISFHNLSEEISAELKLESNDICHRLLCRHTNDIGIRASLYLEKQMLNKYETSKLKLQQTVDGIERVHRDLTTKSNFGEYKRVLNEGPLEYRSSRYFIKDAARGYFWPGSSTTRNKWTVDRVKEEVARHICERLGNQIAESLIEKFKSDVKSSDFYIADYLLKHIDVSGIRQAVYEFAILHMIEMIWEGVKAVVTIVSTFLFTENLDSWSFRDKVADKVHEQIMHKKNGIILRTLDKFRMLQLSKLEEVMKSLNEILFATSGRLESRNSIDCFYHELKVTSKRSEHIQAIGYDDGHFCVYIENSSAHASAISHFLSKYLKNASQVKICEFKEIQVEEYANLQSGDRIVRGPLNNKYGTLGFLLKDSLDNTYCATCRHVTLGCEANQLHVRLSDQSIKNASSKFEPSEKIDISFLKLDQSTGHIPSYTGVRNRNDLFVPGKVFMLDEFTLNPETQVFKWGSTSNLTTGIYKETYERLKDTEESYPWIIIKNEAHGSFAKKGDSGSLVCFTERNNEVAAFLFNGAYSDPDTFACCRIADGLALIQKQIPDINHLFRETNNASCLVN